MRILATVVASVVLYSGVAHSQTPLDRTVFCTVEQERAGLCGSGTRENFYVPPRSNDGFPSFDELNDSIMLESPEPYVITPNGPGSSNELLGVRPAPAPSPTVAPPSPAANPVGLPPTDFRATRIFARESEYPPQEYAAYAIIAFKSLANDDNRARHQMICEAYLRAVPDARTSFVPTTEQLVTVWPLENATSPMSVFFAENETDQCSNAIQGYGLETALTALRHARMVDEREHRRIERNRGPFLLAWSPGHTKGSRDALLLRLDFSDVDLEYQARERFEFWVQRIEQDREAWSDGWTSIPFRNRMSEAADRFGALFISLVGF